MTVATPILPTEASPAPAPLERRVVAPSSGALADVRREMAIELVLEAQWAEDEGASPDLVEALRSKARSILGRRQSSPAPAPMAIRGDSDELKLLITL